MSNRFWAIPFLLVCAAVTQTAFALDPVYSDPSGKAIWGYDPLSYFAGEPEEGKEELSHQWNGAVWHFISEENRQAFIKEPERYAPQYGGYCAWAVSQGYTASTDPHAWNITDGRLYLNYSRSVALRWKIDKATNIEKADNNWPSLSQ
ncbi:MAG: hypothetical protein KTR32_43780 [Granulosicoccus sp.]|nr:hypothetical protein [Granulosicoccus sp.]